MEKVKVDVSYEGGGYGASIDILPGCIAVADSFKELRTLLKEGMAMHLQSMREDGDPIPDAFNGEYKLVYKLDAQALLATYDGIFTKAALSRMSGINEKQLWHYAMGVRRPRPAQREKITRALHGLGKELIDVEL
jgi:predicted RNase H-like HicB family nuclease